MANPNSRSEAVPKFLRKHELAGEEIFGAGYSAFAVLAYFEMNIFVNYEVANRGSFWNWSNQSVWRMGRPNVASLDLHREWTRRQLRDRPGFLLGSETTETERSWVPQILRPGDPEIRQRFPEASFFRDRVEESEAFTLFERTTD